MQNNFLKYLIIALAFPAIAHAGTFYTGYCTYGVANIKDAEKSLPWKGNAAQWYGNAAATAGVSVGSEKKPGAIVVYGAHSSNGGAGHVGVVTPSGTIIDMNGGGELCDGVVNGAQCKGTFNKYAETTTPSKAPILGYIYYRLDRICPPSGSTWVGSHPSCSDQNAAYIPSIKMSYIENKEYITIGENTFYETDTKAITTNEGKIYFNIEPGQIFGKGWSLKVVSGPLKMDYAFYLQENDNSKNRYSLTASCGEECTIAEIGTEVEFFAEGLIAPDTIGLKSTEWSIYAQSKDIEEPIRVAKNLTVDLNIKPTADETYSRDIPITISTEKEDHIEVLSKPEPVTANIKSREYLYNEKVIESKSIVVISNSEFVVTWDIDGLDAIDPASLYLVLDGSDSSVFTQDNIGRISFADSAVEDGLATKLKLKLSAPDAAGEYRESWKLQHQGDFVTLSGISEFTVEVVVKHEEKDLTCNYTFTDVDGLSENSISDVTKDAFAAKFTTQAELDAYDASGQIMTDYGETPILNKIQTSIEKICAWGVASGYDNGSTSRKFGLSHPITRGEFLKMVINSSIKATGKEIPKDEAAYKVPVYKFAAECNKDADILFLDHDDLAKKNENGTYRNRDFFPYVNYALRPDSGDPIMYGFLTKGTEGYSCENESTYGINRPITREQAAKILYKVYQDAKGVNDTDGVCDNDKLDINGSPAFFADYSNKLKWWSCEYAHKAGKYLMKDYTGISENRFLYDNYLTRWQMAVSSCNLLSTLSSHIVSCGQ